MTDWTKDDSVWGREPKKLTKSPHASGHSKRAIYRGANRKRALELLAEAGIPYMTKDHGCHLIVANVYEFLTGTGHWKTRVRLPIEFMEHPHYEGRGVFSLIQRVKDDLRQT